MHRMFKFRGKGVKFQATQLADHYRVFDVISGLKNSFNPSNFLLFVGQFTRKIGGVQCTMKESKNLTRSTRAVVIVQTTCDLGLKKSGIRSDMSKLFFKRKELVETNIRVEMKDLVPSTKSLKQMAHLGPLQQI